jgi:shikimate dehydrogenase
MKQYGLIGHPLSHSFSKNYFSEKFEQENITESSYELFDIENVDKILEIIRSNPKLSGLNVTIPYKETVMKHLTEIDQRAQEIGAVNTIKFSDDNKTLKGFNTDYDGFKNSLKPFLDINHERALILGTGGASKTVKFVLNELNITCLMVSRNPKNADEISYEEVNQYVMKHHQIIVNTTPIGTFPNVNDFPSLPYENLTDKHLLYDLVYNPALTEFLKKGKEKGSITINGLQMLKIQAEKSWEIWNS